jgi:hypothetical protein
VTRKRTRTLATVLVAGLGVAVLSACTPSRAGSAAIVGNDSLSQIQVNQEALDVVSVVKQSGQPAPDIAKINQTLVSSWVTQQVIATVAAEHHVTVTDAEVTSFLDQVVKNAGGQDKLEQQAAAQGNTPPALIPDLIRFYLLGQKLPAALAPNASTDAQTAALRKAIADTAERLGVHVNPRYGQWDAATGQLQPQAGQLSIQATKMDGLNFVPEGTAGAPPVVH